MRSWFTTLKTKRAIVLQRPITSFYRQLRYRKIFKQNHFHHQARDLKVNALLKHIDIY